MNNRNGSRNGNRNGYPPIEEYNLDDEGVAPTDAQMRDFFAARAKSAERDREARLRAATSNDSSPDSSESTQPAPAIENEPPRQPGEGGV